MECMQDQQCLLRLSVCSLLFLCQVTTMVHKAAFALTDQWYNMDLAEVSVMVSG